MRILSFSFTILLLALNSNGYCIQQWDKSLPSSGATLTAWPAAVQAQWAILDTLVSNYRRGESVIYKNSTTLTVTSGEVVVSNSGASLRLFLQDTGNTDITTANLDTGSSFSAGTQYYVYAATSSATASSSTYYISLSSSAPTGPTYYAQIGSFITDGSGNIVSQKVYKTNYGPVVADSTGQSQVQGIYDYGSSASASTFKSAGLLVAQGDITVTGSSSQVITNLPFTSNATYQCSATYDSSTNVTENPLVVKGSGSSMTIYNWQSTRGIQWVCTGY